MTKDRVTEQMAAMPEEIKVQDDLIAGDDGISAG